MGLLDGVVATRSGWLERREVVEVVFDPSVVSFADLVARARDAECVAPVFARTEAQKAAAIEIVGAERVKRSDGEVRTDDDKFRLSKTPLRFVPMTPLQAARVNAALAAREDPRDLLAPSQRRLRKRVEAAPEAGWPEAIGVPFAEAWRAASAVE